MNLETPPPLYELAKPLLEPGTLPKGIPLSIGMIASYGPSDLRASVLYTQQNYTQQTSETLQEFTNLADTAVETIGAIAEDDQAKIDAAMSTLTAIVQENMADQVRHGKVPSAEDLEQVLTVSTLLGGPHSER